MSQVHVPFNKISLGVEGGVLYARYPASDVSLAPSSGESSGMTGLRGGVELILRIGNEMIIQE